MLDPGQARITAFEVVPSLPPPLQPLLSIANNIWWSWHPEAVRLFIRIDRDLWEKSNHNPVLLLGRCSQSRLEEIAVDEGFLTSMQRVVHNLGRHLKRSPWLSQQGRDPGDACVAYFCAEFGLAECMQIYSGGLGCLAGDHLKSASELGLPLVGVGLLYRHGYFQQYLNADGWQQEFYSDLDFTNLPVTPVLDPGGRQVMASVAMPGRELHIAVWKLRVGRNDLYLLDTNLPENQDADRAITGHLYGGDMDMRIRQEIVLGIGGVRALQAVGIRPDICHMNEGHSAFLSLERIRLLIKEHDLSFDEARQQASASHVFTTHTPVPAGIDRFPPELVQRYFKEYHAQLRLDMEGMLALGRENVYARNEFFSMAVLAIRTAQWCNGVSALHGEISRGMWQNIWPGVPKPEIPIIHITNGVHARSWMSADLIDLLDGYIGSRWLDNPSDQSVWALINEVPAEELWRIHDGCRRGLIIWARRQLRRQLERRGGDATQVAAAADALDPGALTVGFARRFATYKRGNLILHDRDRLRAMLADQQRPLQFIIAGKAHPADASGKELIRQLVHFARETETHRRVIFIENYDINVARYLVQGCDVWLNTPRRGMEASGTSGMKAALNGVLNCSVLDGWWDEAYTPEVGFAIGRGEAYTDIDVQDDIESQSLYDLLEKQIIPLFYDRDERGIPQGWVTRMKQCIATLAPQYNTNRMVRQYTEKLYLPALGRARALAANGLARSVELTREKERLRGAWGQLRIETIQTEAGKPLGVGDHLEMHVVAFLGGLAPHEVRVQVYFGELDNDDRIRHEQVVDMSHADDLGGGRHRFDGSLVTSHSGRHGFAIRIVPGGEMFEGVVEPGLIFWDRGSSPAEAPRAVPEAAAAGAVN